MADLLDPLNDEQRAVALHRGGPALVVAGAGSGKTRTVVYRIDHLIAERGAHPAEILAVTFTNKAAGELKERLSALVGRPAGDIWTATFHSAALRVLRVYGERVGLMPGFPVYDEADQQEIIKQILSEEGLSARPGAVRSWIDRVKSRAAGRSYEPIFAELPDWVAGIGIEAFRRVFEAYERRLGEIGAVDFSDILLKAIELFEEHPAVLERVRARARYIHVDEYQDTNPAQHRLIKLLFTEGTELVAVGDPDQSIYGFRSAEVENILRFPKDFPGTKVYHLLTNYRSSEAILKVANAVIAQNRARFEKKLVPVKKGGESVRYHVAYDHRDEAAFIAETAKRLLGRYSAGEIAVLYRTNAQSRVLEEAFRREGVPHRVVGATAFFARREIKDLLAYARIALDPGDEVSLLRVINTPTRGIGARTVEKAVRFARERGISLFAALKRAEEFLDRRQTEAVLNFVELQRRLAELAEHLPVAEFFAEVLSATGYRDHLLAEAGGEDRLENVEELLRAAREWEGEGLAAFLDEVTLATAAEGPGEEEGEAVSLMTLHNAKGLEFKVVFLAGVEEGLLPHRSSVSPKELEEERRLFYVGITRAMDLLYLTRASEREVYGRRERVEESRFLKEIPRELLVPAEHPALAAAEVKRKPQKLGFKGGERVRHPRFGLGTVVAARGEGERAEVTVHFEGVGLKKLLVKYAGLELVKGGG